MILKGGVEIRLGGISCITGLGEQTEISKSQILHYCLLYRQGRLCLKTASPSIHPGSQPEQNKQNKKPENEVGIAPSTVNGSCACHSAKHSIIHGCLQTVSGSHCGDIKNIASSGRQLFSSVRYPMIGRTQPFRLCWRPSLIPHARLRSMPAPYRRAEQSQE
jgi:hypothetical protein